MFLYESIEGYYKFVRKKNEVKLVKYTGKEKKIILPSTSRLGTVTTISPGCFENKEFIEEVIIPEGYKYIDNGAFKGCTNLRQVSLPKSLEVLSFEVFRNCFKLESIKLPSTLQQIGGKCFYNCVKLSDIYIDPSSCKKFVGTNIFTYCPILDIKYKFATIPIHLLKEEPLQIEQISNYLKRPYQYNADLTKDIENYLNTKVNIPLTKYIKDDELTLFTKLTNSKYINNLNRQSQKYKKGILVFYALENTDISYLTTFADLGWLEDLNLLEYAIEVSKEKNLNEYLSFLLDYKSNSLVIKKKLETIRKRNENILDKDPFNYTDMKKIFSTTKPINKEVEITKYKGEFDHLIIPSRIGNSKVTSIKEHCFEGRNEYSNYNKNSISLKSITIMENIKVIKSYSFSNLENLEEIKLPDSLEVIESYVFKGCKKLKRIYIPKNVRLISPTFLQDCKSIIEIIVDKDNPYYDSRNNTNCIIETATNTMIASCSTTMIDSSIEKISSSALLSMNTNDLFVPENIKHIEIELYSNYPLFKSIKVDKNNRYYDSRDNCGCLIETKTNNLLLASLDSFIPNSVKTINSLAFEHHDNLKTIIIPSSVNLIKAYSFANCANLEKVILLNPETQFERYAFYNSSKVTIKGIN